MNFVNDVVELSFSTFGVSLAGDQCQHVDPTSIEMSCQDVSSFRNSEHTWHRDSWNLCNPQIRTWFEF
ncbi:hypothetical protein ARMGADRAFT_1021441 [Armillaria gallica]|uniref:Uncharacterized protein n=1 Tax=Armillaria gallica TaxID=47427 RepID=A0A2H3C941_ARMGA|nr:hypothetical protein ARMGADRAFT_1021441 [Armillaria gallica]